MNISTCADRLPSLLVKYIKYEIYVIRYQFSFPGWYSSLNPGKPVTQLTKVELAEVVKSFYMTTRKKDGNPYKLCSYLAIRRCLSLIFQYDYGLMNVDISCDPEFLDANVVFSQMSHSLRGREENHGMTELWRLTPEKLTKLYTEGQLDFYNTQNPKVLLQTVYFYVCYYTGIGKLSVMRQVVTNDVEEVIENGRLIAYNLNLRKYLPSEKGVGPFTIYEIQGKPWCPVLTIREYLSHRNKSVQSFFQKPLARAQCFSSPVWFKRSRFKDIYPLANMSREAHIDPPLTSGCFTKSRISAEIRYDMSFVYATLYPQCFKSVGGIQQRVKPNAAKKKRTRKQFPTSMVFTSPSCPTTAARSEGSTTMKAEGATIAQSVNKTGCNLTDGNVTPPSMVVPQSFNCNGQYRQPTSHTAYKDPFEQTITTATSNDSQVSSRQQVTHIEAPAGTNILQPSELPNISVTNVYSFKRDATTGTNRNKHDTQVLFPQQSKQPAQPGQPEGAPKKERTLSKEAEMREDLGHTTNNFIAINDDDDDDMGDEYYDLARNDSSSFRRDSTSLPQASCSSNVDSEASSYSAVNGVSPGYRQTYSQSTKSATSHYEPQTKRSRFDTSSHTFLREISASAREQGKGAVLLLLNLLDELSNNKGKELLRDILQEMRVI